VGTAALSNEDRRMLAFTDRFEEQFINQGRQNRSIEATLKEAWTLLSMMPRELLKRIPEDILQAYYQPELT
jgi:V/A-type H+-transporting ATPase subunit B